GAGYSRAARLVVFGCLMAALGCCASSQDAIETRAELRDPSARPSRGASSAAIPEPDLQAEPIAELAPTPDAGVEVAPAVAPVRVVHGRRRCGEASFPEAGETARIKARVRGPAVVVEIDDYRSYWK